MYIHIYLKDMIYKINVNLLCKFNIYLRYFTRSIP